MDITTAFEAVIPGSNPGGSTSEGHDAEHCALVLVGALPSHARWREGVASTLAFIGSAIKDLVTCDHKHQRRVSRFRVLSFLHAKQAKN